MTSCVVFPDRWRRITPSLRIVETVSTAKSVSGDSYQLCTVSGSVVSSRWKMIRTVAREVSAAHGVPGSSGLCSALRGSLFTSSMIRAYARVVASSPVHGTVSGVSRSVWK